MNLCGLQAGTLLKRHSYKTFPVSFKKIWRTAILYITSEQLLLQCEEVIIQSNVIYLYIYIYIYIYKCLYTYRDMSLYI